MARARSAWSLLYYPAVAILLLPPVFALAGYPLISFAKTASMEPTIGVGDVFFVNPFHGDLAVGDVILYHSVSRGELAVHRLDSGGPLAWFTRGDANPSTDQDTGEPLVTADRIRGRVVAFGGAPLVVPKLGVNLIELEGQYRKASVLLGSDAAVRAVIFGSLALVFGLLAFTGSKVPPPSRARGPLARRLERRLLPRGILGKHVGAVALLLLVASTALAAVTARDEVYTSLIVVEGPGDGERTASPGEALVREVEAGSLGLLPALIVVDEGSPNVRDPVVGRAPRGGVGKATFGEVAGASRGLQEDIVVVWRYPDVFPEAWTLALHGWKPGAPFAALAAVIALPGYAWYRFLGISNVRMARWLGMEEAA